MRIDTCPRCQHPYQNTWPWVDMCDECYAEVMWPRWRWSFYSRLVFAIIVFLVWSFPLIMLLVTGDKGWSECIPMWMGSVLFIPWGLAWFLPLKWVLESWDEPREGSGLIGMGGTPPWVEMDRWRVEQSAISDARHGTRSRHRPPSGRRLAVPTPLVCDGDSPSCGSR